MKGDKAAFRRCLKALEREITEDQRLASDKALQQNLLCHAELECAHTVLLYLSMGAEPDTGPIAEELLRRGKTVLMPRCLPERGMEARLYDPARLARHRYGMLEPDITCPVYDRSRIDLILVPALCYDRACSRMGRGGGYYDRYLKGYVGRTIGLCRDILLQDSLPTEAWDQAVECVITETEVLTRKRSAD